MSVLTKEFRVGERLSEVELADEVSGVRSAERKVGARRFASEATPADFGVCAGAAAELVFRGVFSRRRHIQSSQTTAIIAPASAIPPAPLSGL